MSSRLKILHVVPTYYPAIRYGGPIWSIHSLCNALARRGHLIDVVTTNVDGPTNLKIELNTPLKLDEVNVYYFNVPFFRRLFWSLSMTKFLIKNMVNYDFVHLHSSFLLPTAIAARIASFNSIPWCVSPRGSLVPELIKNKSSLAKKIALALYEKKTLEEASFIHATSEIEKIKLLEMSFKLKNIIVIPNGVEIPNYKNYEKFESKLFDEFKHKDFILFLGRISWKKRIDLIINAMKFLPNLNLVIAGNDEERLTEKLANLSKNIGVNSRIFFCKAVYGSEKNKLIELSKMLILVSQNENFGNVVLEAMIQKKPVAVSNGVGLSTLVKKENAGIILSEDPEEIARNINKIINNPVVLNTMGENGGLAAKKFSWDSIAWEIEKCYELQKKA